MTSLTVHLTDFNISSNHFTFAIASWPTSLIGDLYNDLDVSSLDDIDLVE